MRISLLAAAAALTIIMAAPPADALPIDRSLPTAVPNLVEQSQFVFGGRNYCWYNNGWNGPGFYWCGYSMRRGRGWGGGAGWHGWHHARPPRAHHRPHHSHRPRMTTPRAHRPPARSHRSPARSHRR